MILLIGLGDASRQRRVPRFYGPASRAVNEQHARHLLVSRDAKVRRSGALCPAPNLAFDGSPGDCYDNAVAERFFRSLKHEWTKHESFVDVEAARLSGFKYVETFYNPVRLHQTLGYKSLDQFEAEYAPRS